MGNNSFATTGLQTFAIGSVIDFTYAPWRNGQPWDLTGGSATLLLTDPGGGSHSVAATIQPGGVAVAQWPMQAPAGTWTFAFSATDASGRTLVQLPEAFEVVTSPS